MWTNRKQEDCDLVLAITAGKGQVKNPVLTDRNQLGQQSLEGPTCDSSLE
jgi:hypothetical protein